MNQIPEKTDKTSESFDVRKIVAAVDLSKHSKKTAAYAAEFAKNFGASITLVHAFAPEPITEFTTEEVHERYEADLRASERDLCKLAEAVRETYPDCDFEFRVGDPAEQVTLVAKDLDADLIITASHHPGFLGRLFGMDQAPRILHRTQCPVLVYHEGKDSV